MPLDRKGACFIIFFHRKKSISLYEFSFCDQYFYRPQRSCGQGNVFTGVCLSTGGEGVCLSACWDAIPPGPGRPPRTRQIPPGKKTPAYGLRAAGTHPTGMHSCSNYDDVPFVLFQLTTAARKVMLRSRPRPPRRQASVPRGGTYCTAAATCSSRTDTKTSRRPRDTVKYVNQPRRLFFPDTVFQKSVNKSTR